jgi:recombination protein RecR
MDNTQKLIEMFREFPGIGPRQAKRFVYFLLNKNNGYAGDLARLIGEVKKGVTTCASCFRFFQTNASHNSLCPTCADTSRDNRTLMLVSHDVDFENIERTKSFSGYYFILGGSVPILEKNPGARIRERELLDVIEKRMNTDDTSRLSEIIIALNYNPEGEHTLNYIQNLLRPLSEKHGVKLSTLGRGLSTGTELEYSDPETIKNALKNRV